MKNLITLLSLIVLLISCSENDVNQNSEEINQLKINEVLTAKNIDEQKLYYSLLNENEKFTLWNSKLERVISSNSFNKKQVKLIKELKFKISPIHFIEDSDEQIYFQTVIIPKYLERLQKEFTTEKIGAIFYTASRDSFTTVDNEGGGTATNCDCNRNSMVSCSWLNTSSCKERAETNGCQTSTSGCGFMYFLVVMENANRLIHNL